MSRKKARKPDVLIRNKGTVFVFNPLSPDARDWFEKNVQIEPYQRFGTSIVVEHRYALPLARGLADEGFILA